MTTRQGSPAVPSSVRLESCLLCEERRTVGRAASGRLRRERKCVECDVYEDRIERESVSGTACAESESSMILPFVHSSAAVVKSSTLCRARWPGAEQGNHFTLPHQKDVDVGRVDCAPLSVHDRKLVDCRFNGHVPVAAAASSTFKEQGTAADVGHGASRLHRDLPVCRTLHAERCVAGRPWPTVWA